MERGAGMAVKAEFHAFAFMAILLFFMRQVAVVFGGDAFPEFKKVSESLRSYVSNYNLPQGHSVQEIRIDLTGDGKDEILISDESGVLVHQQRGWKVFLNTGDDLYTGLSTFLDWNSDQPGVVVAGLPGLDQPALVIALPGSIKRRKVMRYRVMRVDAKTETVSFSNWLRDYYPGKSDAEIDLIFQSFLKTGRYLTPIRHTLEELSKEYEIITYENVAAHYGLDVNADAGYRLIGPGLPKEGKPMSPPEIKARALRKFEEAKANLEKMKSGVEIQKDAHATSETVTPHK
jgi:hypothetical protein